MESEKKGIIRSKAIRDYCLWCCGDSKPEVRKCISTNCPLWRFRMGNEDVSAPGKRQKRGEAIRARCLDCSGWIKKEVRNCSHTNCPLHKYRA